MAPWGIVLIPSCSLVAIIPSFGGVGGAEESEWWHLAEEEIYRPVPHGEAR